MTIQLLVVRSRNLVALRVLFWEDDFMDGQTVEELHWGNVPSYQFSKELHSMIYQTPIL